MNGGPIQRVVTHGTFELDGGSWEVDNNIWLVGDDNEVVVFDAAHDAGPIVMAGGGRHVVAVVCTHGHNDHVTVEPELRDAPDAHELLAIHTPGHSPGSVCWHAPELNALFSGDTLFQGGPGATGRSYSDFPTIIDSIRSLLLTLPAQTVVHTGHGDGTTIGAEAPHLADWIAHGS